MADEILNRDANQVPVMAGVTNDANLNVTRLRVNPSTYRLLTDVSISSVTISGGTVQVSQIAGGSVVVASITVPITVGQIAGGSVIVSSVTTPITISQVAGGSIQVVNSNAPGSAGSLAVNIGASPLTISQIAGGSVQVINSTVAGAAGSIAVNVVTGLVQVSQVAGGSMIVASVTAPITVGQIAGGSVIVASITAPITVGQIAGGSIYVAGGTVTVNSTGLTLQTASGTATASGGGTISLISAVTSKRIKVYAYSIITYPAAGFTVQFLDSTLAGGTILGTVPLQALAGSISGISSSVPAPSFLFAGSAGKELDLLFTGAGTIAYNISYWTNDAI